MQTFSFLQAEYDRFLFLQRLQTPLHVAVESGHLDVVQILLAGGASMETREKVHSAH